MTNLITTTAVLEHVPYEGTGRQPAEFWVDSEEGARPYLELDPDIWEEMGSPEKITVQV